MYETRSKEAIKASIFDGLRKLGADYAEANYSGGNDEGGVDEVTCYRTLVDDERIAIPTPEMGWEHPLQEAFDELLSLDFYSWSGEFSAMGTVFADTRTGKIWRSGTMSTYMDDPDAGEY